MSDVPAGQAIDTLLAEERRYPPPPEFAAQANARPEIYERGFDELWTAEAERVTFFEPWQELYEWELPSARWYVGGKLNVCFNCVDRHVEAGLGDRVAYHWEGEPGDTEAITYAELQRRVVRFANALREIGVGKGTAVAIYMGMVPDLPVAMLACTRLGAPHTVVFGGFSADSLSSRMNDMGCEVLVTQDEAWRRGSTVPLKRTADEAMADAPGIRACLVVRRTGGDVPMTEGRDRWLDEVGDRGLRRSRVVPVRADGRRGSALPHVHERHDRAAEGHRPHDRRLPRRRRGQPPLHLRPQARPGRLLVRGRHRLDHRPLVHRLRPARERDDERDLRGHAGLPGQGPLVGDRRALRRHDPLHGADRDPRAHEMGTRARRYARPLDAAPARLRRRADQPRGLGLVPREHRRRPLPDRRHLVADRDGHGDDHTAPRDHDGEAGLGDASRSRASTLPSTTRPGTRSARAAAGISSCASPGRR